MLHYFKCLQLKVIMSKVVNNYSLYTSVRYLVTSATTNVNPPTTVPSDHEFDKKDESHTFIIVPLCAVCVVVLLTGLVLLFLRKKRLDRLRHHLMPFYNFDPGEEGEDWEAELLEENGDILGRKGYRSIDTPETEHPQLPLQ